MELAHIHMFLGGMSTAIIISSSIKCSSKLVLTILCVRYRSQCCIVVAGCCSCSRLQQGAANSLPSVLAVSAWTNKLSTSAVDHLYISLLTQSFVASIPPCNVAHSHHENNNVKVSHSPASPVRELCAGQVSRAACLVHPCKAY